MNAAQSSSGLRASERSVAEGIMLARVSGNNS
jgi:hypothetical protein